MPLYEVNHSIPLSREQKDALAEFITTLHATTFVTPKLFVNVSFFQPPPAGAIYSAGKFRGQTVPNHIHATIRTGTSRTKELYDDVGVKIQNRWNEIVSDASLGAVCLNGNASAADQKRVKMLHGVFFTPLVAALEGGLVVPSAGEEGAWFKQNMAFFKEQAEVYHNEDIKDMLQELSEREDLKQLIG